MKADMLKGHLDLLLLATLADGPAHGYAVVDALRRRSNGTFSLPEGTVYVALHRLEATGLLASHWAIVVGRRRRLYELTPRGLAALSARRAAWTEFADGVSAVVGGRRCPTPA
jgi:PadR family transcriptional regulator PadR